MQDRKMRDQEHGKEENFSVYVSARFREYSKGEDKEVNTTSKTKEASLMRNSRSFSLGKMIGDHLRGKKPSTSPRQTVGCQ